MPPLKALLLSAATSVPAFVVTYWLMNGRSRSFSAFVAGLAANAPVFVPIYFVGALAYGSLLWVVLRALGALNLPALLVGSVIPVLILVFGHAIFRGSFGPGLHVVLFALGLPCVAMAVSLWYFGVARA
jgi:hypothetical protein